MAGEMKACPFCGSTMDGEHADSCYFTVDSKFRAAAAKNADLSLAPAVLKAWNTRAQLPSQGGEAVAWRVTGRGGITVTAQYPEWAEADCLLTITPLYTHPVDQVAECVFVSRELLDLAYQAVHALAGMGIDGYTEGRCAELRQLLAKSEGVKK